MTKATREPDVEEYLELARAGDYDALIKFSDECFGTAEDLDEEGLNAFAKTVLPIIEQEVKDMMDNAPEATQEMVDTAQASELKTEGVVAGSTEDTTKEAANDSADEAVVEAVEATTES